MKVYVVMARWKDTDHEYEDGEGIIGEVFVNEQDAKRCKAAADVDGVHGEYLVVPRTLRTAWRG